MSFYLTGEAETHVWTAFKTNQQIGFIHVDRPGVRAAEPEPEGEEIPRDQIDRGSCQGESEGIHPDTVGIIGGGLGKPRHTEFGSSAN